jgi:hypothetical protein
MDVNQFEQLHQTLDGLFQVRHGETWPDSLQVLVEGLIYNIALDTGFAGSCTCGGDHCAMQVSVTDMYNYTTFVEWPSAQFIYSHLPNKETDPNLDEDYYQQPEESDLAFAIRGYSDLLESDGAFSLYDEDRNTCMQLASLSFQGKFVWFWIKSHPQTADYYFEVHPKVWPDEASATAGLREIGFSGPEELTEADLPRLGFPQK